MNVQQFWSSIAPAPAEMCWEWGRGLGKNGYGCVWYLGKFWGAHKLAYTLSKGEVPKGQYVRHLCHNRACCNPSHLEVGSPKENMQDSVRDGRTARGEKQGHSKLTTAQVGQIKEMASYRTQQAIADHFGVNQCQVSRILKGLRWVHHS